MNHPSITGRKFPVVFVCAWILLLLISFSLQAGGFDFNARCRKAYRNLINLQFSDADKLILAEKSANPHNLIPCYLENFRDFLTLYIGEQEDLYDRLKPESEKRYDLLKEGDKESPFYRFCLGEHALQWALLHLRFGEYSTGAFELRQSYLFFSENRKSFPDFLPNTLGFGVVQVMSGLIPDNFRWIADLLGMQGGIEEGLANIRDVSSYNGNNELFTLYRPEAFFYLALITANLQQQKKDALKMIPLYENSPGISEIQESPLFAFAKASILLRNNRNDEAMKVLLSRKTLQGSFPFYFLDYMEGITLLNRLNISAENSFREYTCKFTGRNYIKSAYQRIAWIALLKGDTAGYHENMFRAANLGIAKVDEDKQALREAENKEMPSTVLLRARLLFDGGYYRQALEVMLNSPVNSVVHNHKDLLEYTYRLARIYHESGEIEKALEYYDITILRGKKEPYYFACNAALQMGLIYEGRGDNDRAAVSFRLCLSMEPEEYKTSLEMKAKAGLNRIRKKGVRT